MDERILDDLRERLRRTRWPDEVRDAGWDYGANLAYMKELCAYWADGFDWRARERAIDGFAHFRAEVEGLGIHFIHERGRGPAPIPLVVTHGWPSSFTEMLELIPRLTDPARHGADPADSFDVVVPSVPGFGFSDRARRARHDAIPGGRPVGAAHGGTRLSALRRPRERHRGGHRRLRRARPSATGSSRCTR